MKYRKTSFILFFSIFKKFIKIQTTFHQYQKLYSTCHDIVHIPAKFRENTATMRFQVTVRKAKGDGQTDVLTETTFGVNSFVSSFRVAALK